MGSHAPQSIAPVPADGAPERLDAGVGLHVPLRRRRRRRHHITARTLPAALRAGGGPWRFWNAPGRSGLPLSAIIRLVRRQIIQRTEVDSAGEANQLTVLWRRAGLRRGGTGSLLTATRGAIVPFVDTIVLISAEDYVALFAL